MFAVELHFRLHNRMSKVSKKKEGRVFHSLHLISPLGHSFLVTIAVFQLTLSISSLSEYGRTCIVSYRDHFVFCFICTSPPKPCSACSLLSQTVRPTPTLSTLTLPASPPIHPCAILSSLFSLALIVPTPTKKSALSSHSSPCWFVCVLFVFVYLSLHNSKPCLFWLTTAPALYCTVHYLPPSLFVVCCFALYRKPNERRKKNNTKKLTCRGKRKMEKKKGGKKKKKKKEKKRFSA
ncbi:MAG: hypothetical protein JOS17DRAFT_249699 [Linnemannia elongata]|nr:MAG: hypothetical protein JOS17DRAFT_249699 [Linnemannia elongata]